MTVDRSSRPFKIVVVAPGESIAQGLDVTAIVKSFSGSCNLLDQSGIQSWTGDIVLNAYSPGISIECNPRRDRVRWARGNRVVIWLADSTGALVKYKTVHILKEPLPPTPRTRETITLDIGDKLSLLDFRQPPGDESGVIPGTTSTRSDVVGSLLRAAGAGNLTGSIPGDVNCPLQKLGSEGYIQQAGQIAFAAGRYLWCDATGDVRASAIPDDEDATTHRVIAIEQDELGYEAISSEETPVEIVRCTGTENITKYTDDFNKSTTETWGPAAIVSPNAGGITVFSRETIEESWGPNSRTVKTYRVEPRGLVFPDVESNRLSLVPSLDQTETFAYEPGPEGKLLRIEKHVRKPYGVALREYYATQSAQEQAFNRNNMIAAERTIITYDYSKEQTIGIFSDTAEPQGAILPDKDWTFGNPAFLVPSAAENQTWKEVYKGEWKYTKSTYEAVARAFPEVIEVMPPETPTSAMLGILLTDKQVVTSNSGQAQPPAPDRRKPKTTTEEKPIEGVAEFRSYAGAEYQERERTYDVPYADQEELNAAARRLGKLLIGRHLGQNIEFALSDYWLNDRPPLQTISVVEPDGSEYKFLLNNILIAFDERNCFLGGDGIWLGEIVDD